MSDTRDPGTHLAGEVPAVPEVGEVPAAPEAIARAKELAAEFEPDLVEFTRRLVRTPSITGDEHAVSELLLAQMRSLGYHHAFRDSWGNVVGWVDGLAEGPSILFNGHMDVVEEGNGAKWSPFVPWGGELAVVPTPDADHTAVEEVEVVHGRGSSDLKGGAAAQLYAGAILSRLREEGYVWPGRFLCVQVAMEEPGEMFSMRKFVADTMPEHAIAVDAMVCCEPSSLKVALGHRGRVELKVVVHGRSCHGSSPWLGVNAAVHAARLICAIEDEVAAHALVDPHLGRSQIALTMVDIAPNALAIIPDTATLIFDRRIVPGETPDSVVAQVQGVIDRLANEVPEFNAEVEVNTYYRRSYTGRADTIASAKESWLIEEDHPFVRACGAGLEAVGEPFVTTHWPFSTDVPAVANGLGKPCIGYSAGQEFCIHTEEERIRTDYLKRSLVGNVGLYLQAAGLPMSSFTVGAAHGS